MYQRLGGESYKWGNDISCSFINKTKTRNVQPSSREYQYSSKKAVTGVSEEANWTGKHRVKLEFPEKSECANLNQKLLYGTGTEDFGDNTLIY